MTIWAFQMCDYRAARAAAVEDRKLPLGSNPDACEIRKVLPLRNRSKTDAWIGGRKRFQGIRRDPSLVRIRVRPHKNPLALAGRQN
jgi:3'-phosphoadenosine 5'-phosphosulfate sulfotransferase (PAPS reductase)/FAD synthetase